MRLVRLKYTEIIAQPKVFLLTQQVYEVKREIFEKTSNYSSRVIHSIFRQVLTLKQAINNNKLFAQG
jgi:hypothetical protein